MSEIQTVSTGYSTGKQPECLFDRIAVGAFSIVSFSMSMLLTVVISLEVLLRYVFQQDLFGYEEWIKVFAMWLYFTGAAYGAFEGTHISADLVQSYCRGITRRVLTVLRNVITFAVSLLFAWYGWVYFKFEFLGPLGTGRFVAKSILWHIPAWISSLAVFLGVLFMAYYFGWDLIRSVEELARGGSEE